MREIKFRGRDKLDDGAFSEWLYGSLDLTEYRPIIRPKGGIPETVMPETIGQYIGLKDKNGTEIYEGDVLEIQTKDYVYQAVVVYVSDLASFFVSEEPKEYISFTDVVFTIDDGGSITVIGNVFDDPELKEQFWEVWNQENLN